MTLLALERMQLAATASEFLFREAHYLDSRQWEDWLDLYAEQCEFWVPSWKTEDLPAADPQSEMSLIYYPSRAGLEDRVWRVKSGRSVASKPLPRTQHQVSNVRVVSAEPAASPRKLQVEYEWCVHQFAHKILEAQLFFGRAEATLVYEQDAWRFARKKVLLLNDYVPAKLDFYSL